MLLRDEDEITELMQRAINDGIETIEQYNSWLLGYVTASRECMTRRRGDLKL